MSDSDRAIAVLIEQLGTSLNSRLDTQDGVLKEIKEQTMRTNGRVTKLEEWKATIAAVEAAEEKAQEKKEKAEERKTRFWERIEVQLGAVGTVCAGIGWVVSHF